MAAAAPLPMQSRPNAARFTWTLLPVYWTLCTALGLLGYCSALLRQPLFASQFQEPFREAGGRAAFGWAALVAWRALGLWGEPMQTYGRRVRPLTVAGFALVNGLLESFAWCTAFNLGAAAAQQALFGTQRSWGATAVGSGQPTPQLAAAFIGGVAFLNAYQGMMRGMFWEALVYPPTVYRKGWRFQLGLISVAATWAAVYFLYGDLQACVALRVFMDACDAAAFRLQPPRSLEGRREE